MDDLISVIVPVYNSEKFLPECIESVLRQTYSNIELIIINDGSTDKSLSIAKNYENKDNRIRIINSTNKGVSSARNLGLGQVKGSFVCFLDSDDFLVLNAIEMMYKSMQQYQADIVACGASNKLKYGSSAEKRQVTNVWSNDEALYANLCGNHFTYGACAKLYRVEKICGIRFPEGKRIHEDGFFVFLCLLRQPRFITEETIVYCYRDNVNSSSHEKYCDKYLDILKLADEKIKIIHNKKPQLDGIAKNIIIRANLSLLIITCRGDWRTVHKLVKKLTKEVRLYKKIYIPIEGFESKLFLIVCLRMFGLFRVYYRLRYLNQKNS